MQIWSNLIIAQDIYEVDSENRSEQRVNIFGGCMRTWYATGLLAKVKFAVQIEFVILNIMKNRFPFELTVELHLVEKDNSIVNIFELNPITVDSDLTCIGTTFRPKELSLLPGDYLLYLLVDYTRQTAVPIAVFPDPSEQENGNSQA